MKSEDVQKRKFPWKLIVGIILSVWLLRSFCAESFRIPANQMENTLLEGDHLWVWKSCYGMRMPQTPFSLPFYHDTIPGLKIRSYFSLGIPEIYLFRKFPDRNDIVVFNIPSLERDIPVDRKKITVARCVGFPGDTVSLQRGILRINGDIVAQPLRAIDAYFCADSVKSVIDSLFLKLNINPVSTKIGKKSLYFLSRYDYFRVKSLLASPDLLQGVNLDRNNFQIVLPSFGEATSVNAGNASFIAQLMSIYEGREVQVRDGRIYEGETEIVSYRFSQPYYWVLADNREMGTDSRSFGALPHSHLVGKGSCVWFSFDSGKPFYKGFRLDRVFKFL
ncbi:signal peptidase I [Coprobacter sp.]|jgi:signal peptidase I|uniref:signal peptidase I n=1 Tax=Coprobacter sp. TaxID=1941478 RepID=UPI0025F1BB78|nr:signal peptidase I [uncultured Coprobacter sp.]